MLSNKQKIFLHRLYRKYIFDIPLSGRPSVFIVGAQKAGTTSLHEYLCKHPDIKGGLLKEIHFFNDENRYQKGVSWYETHFKNFNIFKEVTFLDATPEYMTSETAITRLKKYNPHAKILVILREPVSRAYSAWNFYSKLPKFSNQLYDFSKLIQDEINSINLSSDFKLASLGIVKFGCYSTQLASLFKNFSTDQVLIIGSKELSVNTLDVLNKIFKFIGVSHYDPAKCVKRQRNKGSYSVIPPTAKGVLEEFYQPYNADLFNMLGYVPKW
jgi:hypothetical protein